MGTVAVQTVRIAVGNGYRADRNCCGERLPCRQRTSVGTVTVQTVRTSVGNGYRADRENCSGERLPCRQRELLVLRGTVAVRQREQLPGTVAVQTERTAAGNGYREDREDSCWERLPCRQRELNTCDRSPALQLWSVWQT